MSVNFIQEVCDMRSNFGRSEKSAAIKGCQNILEEKLKKYVANAKNPEAAKGKDIFEPALAKIKVPSRLILADPTGLTLDKKEKMEIKAAKKK
jgi:hypothetical protein